MKSPPRFFSRVEAKLSPWIFSDLPNLPTHYIITSYKYVPFCSLMRKKNDKTIFLKIYYWKNMCYFIILWFASKVAVLSASLLTNSSRIRNYFTFWRCVICIKFTRLSFYTIVGVFVMAKCNIAWNSIYTRLFVY